MSSSLRTAAVLIKQCVSPVMTKKAITHVMTTARSFVAVMDEVYCHVAMVETKVIEMSSVCFAIIDLERTTWMSTIEPVQRQWLV